MLGFIKAAQVAFARFAKPVPTKRKGKGKAKGKSGVGKPLRHRAELMRVAKQEARLARLKRIAKKTEPKRPDDPRGQKPGPI